MIQIRFMPFGSDTGYQAAWPAVPCVGEYVQLPGDAYRRVQKVIWSRPDKEVPVVSVFHGVSMNLELT